MAVQWSLCILVALIVHQLASLQTPNRRCAKYCNCRPRSMRCDGNKCPSGMLPRPPDNIISVEFVNMRLGNLTREMVANLSHCKMTSLSFENSTIASVEDGSFQDLTYIRTFKLVGNFISVYDIYRVLSSISKKLERFQVKVGTSDVETMNTTIFLQFPKLSHLGLSLRSVQQFNTNDLTRLLALRNLDISGNSLRNIVMDNLLYNVTDLDLSGNNFISVPPICRADETPVMPRLRDLDIGHNAIRVLDVTNLKCLHNLLKLTLSGNRIDILPNNGFTPLTRLRSLYIHHLPLTRIEPFAFNSSSLSKLMFTDIPILTPKRFDPARLFSNTPNLEILNMMNTKLDINDWYFKQLLLPLRNIRSLNFQGGHIKVLPSGVFSKLRKLETLVLTGNYFSYVGSDVFENVTSIKKLVLDGCNIKIIKEDSFPLEFRLNVKKINLCNNPFICTCELLWFRTWMKEVIANKSIRFINFPTRYECRAPMKKMMLKDYNPTIKSCTPVPWYAIFLPILFGTLLVLCISGLVAYRYRWYLFYWISLLRRRRQRKYMVQKEIKYDAFVSYSNEDGDWVYDELLNYVEGQLGLRLCEHSRDFEGGKLIVDNVFDALDTSERTILVISNEYMKSDWCQFELQMALNSFYKHETDLVVVMLEQIRPRHVTSTLRALMTSTTYIEWPLDDGAKGLFRERIKNCLLN